MNTSKSEAARMKNSFLIRRTIMAYSYMNSMDLCFELSGVKVEKSKITWIKNLKN